jgi:hypothetical protein
MTRVCEAGLKRSVEMVFNRELPRKVPRQAPQRKSAISPNGAAQPARDKKSGESA